MRHFFFIYWMLSLVISSCNSTETTVYKDYYQKLDTIREHKHKELYKYMEFVHKKAFSLKEDEEMKQFFKQKLVLFQRMKNNQAIYADRKKIAWLREKITDRYISKYLIFYDILFIDTAGNIFYTVRRQADYHKNIFEGELAQTALARQLKKSPTEAFVDFQQYQISGEPSAFFIEPFLSESKLLGWFIPQFSINKINDIFSIEEALGHTGEVFLVNKNYYMLTDSRFYAGSTILSKHLSKDNIHSKFKEGKGQKIVTDYRGYQALSSFEVVSILNSKWLIIAKIDEDEILTEKYKMNRKKYRKALIKLTERKKISLKDSNRDLSKHIEVDMDEIKRSANGKALYTHGVSACTAVIISKRGKFAYLAHISANDRIYGGMQTDLVRRMQKRITKFDLLNSEKRNIEIIIISPQFRYSESLIDIFLDWDVFLSQIKLIHNTAAQYANLSHNYVNGETLVEWKLKKPSVVTNTISANDVKSLGKILKARIIGAI